MRLLPASLACIALLGTAGAACGVTEPREITVEVLPQTIQAGAPRVTAGADGFHVMNQADRPIVAVVLEKETSHLVDLAYCTSGPSCPVQAPGTERIVPWTSVIGYAADRPAYLVYWWYGDSGTNNAAISIGAAREDVSP